MNQPGQEPLEATTGAEPSDCQRFLTALSSESTASSQASASTNSSSNNSSKTPTNPQDSSGQKDWWEGGSMANSDDNSEYFYSDDSTNGMDKEEEASGKAPAAAAAATTMKLASNVLSNVNVSSPSRKRSHFDDGAFPPSRNDDMLVIENDVKPGKKKEKLLSSTGSVSLSNPVHQFFGTAMAKAIGGPTSASSSTALQVQRLQQPLTSGLQAGPFFSKRIADVFKDKSPSQRVHFVPEFTERCNTAAFRSFVKEAGLQDSSFEPNPDAVAGNTVYNRFVEACTKKLPEYATLAIVFHGTGEDNIPHILKDGLDPKKRRGQAYGPGEYFSTDPGFSTSYCRKSSSSYRQQQNSQGGKMLVFLVVRPFYPQEKIDGRPYASNANVCPPHYVVVPTTEHQLPLGVLSYGSVEHAAIQRAEAMRAKLQQLNYEIQQKENQANLARLKAQVIQKIINEQMDVAGEFYAKTCEHLDTAAKKEISTFAHTKYKYDTDFISFYFPDLPPPMTAEEEKKIISVEALEGEVCAKKMELEKQSKLGTASSNK